MSFADYDITDSYTGITITGGNDGTEATHADLASPLTLQGAHCREWRSNLSEINIRRYQYLAIKGSSDPRMVAVPDTKAMRATMWVRLYPSTGTAAESCLSIHLKTSGVCNIGFGQYNPPGIGLYAGHSGTFNFGSSYLAPKIGLSIASATATTWYPSLLAISYNTWYQIRLEVTPIATLGIVDSELVEAFYNSGTEADPTWTSIFSQVNLDSGGRWIVYGNASLTKCAFGVQLKTGSSGELCRAYSDSFQVQMKPR